MEPNIARIEREVILTLLVFFKVVNGAVVDTDPQRTSSHKPALGKSWKSVPHVRLYFEVIDVTDCVSKNCIAVLSKSSRQVRNIIAQVFHVYLYISLFLHFWICCTCFPAPYYCLITAFIV